MRQKRPDNAIVRPRRKESQIKFSDLSVDENSHADFRKAMIESARSEAILFSSYLMEIKEQLRKSDALGVLASISNYGLRAVVSSKGIERADNGIANIDQHHVELLQAIMLTIPKENLNKGILTPNFVQKTFDAIFKINEAFFCQRIVEAENVTDEAEILIRSLQERVRLHTQGVRNWGYFQEVVNISRELFRTLDANLVAHHSFSASDLIEVMLAVIKEYERRHNEHILILRKIIKCGSTRKMVSTYYQLVPDLEGTPEEFLKLFNRNVAREQIMACIMAHFDLRLAQRAKFTPEELALITGRPLEIVDAVFRELSLSLGALVDINPEHIFLGNPVWERPIVKLENSYFIPLPQMVFSHIHRIIDRLVSSANIKRKLSDRRSRFLEEQLESVFRTILPDADIRPSVKWHFGRQQFESDLLVVADRTLIIAEAKSHRLTPEGLRGAPERVRRHINEMVLDPSIQSERLEKLIYQARMGNAVALETMQELGIDASFIDRVIRISVTLDDLSVLSSAEPDFKKAGWVPSEHQLAPTILISDLICISKILNNPIIFLHYLSERSDFQKSVEVIGDELDFLGLYLLTGFNISSVQEQKKKLLVLDGLSKPIDQYFMSLEEGVLLSKPKLELRPLFQQIINRLTEKKPLGWTTIGLHLLSCADLSEQSAIERSLIKLRANVRKNYRDPAHIGSLQIQPPEKRKARIIFYIFAEKRRSELKKAMESYAAEAIELDQIDACVVFARGTETWVRPFEAVLLVQREKNKNNSSL